MKKSVFEKKWRCFKPKGSNGFWYVETLTGESVCTTYVNYDGSMAKQIVKDHNKQLIIKKNEQIKPN